MNKELLKTRVVGLESRKTYLDYIDNGFFDKYMSGCGVEIGGKGANGNTTPILPGALQYDIGDVGYNGITLPLPDNSQNFIYSSHVIEHLPEVEQNLKEWMRVVAVGGHIVIISPHQYLYEKKASLPSRFNGDHKNFFTPGKLLSLIENTLAPNSYRVRLVQDEDKGFDYTIVPSKHSGGEYQFCVVLQKIDQPSWNIE